MYIPQYRITRRYLPVSKIPTTETDSDPRALPESRPDAPADRLGRWRTKAAARRNMQC